MDYSPALSATSDFSDMTEEELDKYFASCAPLSNLPTPPPAKYVPQLVSPSEVQRQTPELEVYASHLSNLVPTNVTAGQPSISTIQGFLERANLPIESVALAACVLDALSQRFASSWRTAFSPLQPELNYFSLKQTPSVSSEVVVLSALSLAHGFLSDRDRSTKQWAMSEGACSFTVREIEITKWCILQEMDFGLHRITDAMVQRMLRDMQQRSSGSSTMPSLPAKKTYAEEIDDRRPRGSFDMHGAAVWKFGIQTPEPSP